MGTSAPVRPLVETRAVTAADEPLLRRLFVESRDDLALLPDAVRGPLVDMQYAARRSQYAAAHPGADHRVLRHEGLDVGTLMVDRSAAEVRLLDIAVDAAHRRRGLARAALVSLLEQAAASERPVSLQVWHDNQPARRLYEQLGFTATATDAGHLTMVASPTGPREA